MRSLRLPTAAIGLAAAAALSLSASAHGADRAPIRDCGDVDMSLSAITAQGTTCANALAIAKAVPRSSACKKDKHCRVKSYTCLLGVVGKELTLVRCENSTQTRFVRFEFGA
jgi:hypothetical protein